MKESLGSERSRMRGLRPLWMLAHVETLVLTCVESGRTSLSPASTRPWKKKRRYSASCNPLNFGLANILLAFTATTKAIEAGPSSRRFDSSGPKRFCEFDTIHVFRRPCLLYRSTTSKAPSGISSKSNRVRPSSESSRHYAVRATAFQSAIISILPFVTSTSFTVRPLSPRFCISSSC